MKLKLVRISRDTWQKPGRDDITICDSKLSILFPKVKDAQEIELFIRRGEPTKNSVTLRLHKSFHSFYLRWSAGKWEDEVFAGKTDKHIEKTIKIKNGEERTYNLYAKVVK